MANLEILDPSSNHLRGPFPAELGSLPQLRHLSVNDNDLVGGLQVEPGALGHLHSFYFHNTWVAGPLSEWLQEVAASSPQP